MHSNFSFGMLFDKMYKLNERTKGDRLRRAYVSDLPLNSKFLFILWVGQDSEEVEFSDFGNSPTYLQISMNEEFLVENPITCVLVLIDFSSLIINISSFQIFEIFLTM